MNCPNCGRELAEGEVCNCLQNEVFPNAEPIMEPQINEMPQEAPAPQAQEQPSFEAPQFEMPQFEASQFQQPQYQPPQFQQPYTEQYQQPQGEFVPPVYGADPSAPFQPQYYAPTAPADLPARSDYPEGYKIKRKYVAVILGATLGVFGIHNFYLGNQSKAIAQLLLSTVGSLFFFLGPVAAAVWSLVETVQILTETINKDANGFKIQTFEEALVKTRMEAEKQRN